MVKMDSDLWFRQERAGSLLPCLVVLLYVFENVIYEEGGVLFNLGIVEESSVVLIYHVVERINPSHIICNML